MCQVSQGDLQARPPPLLPPPPVAAHCTPDWTNLTAQRPSGLRLCACVMPPTSHRFAAAGGHRELQRGAAVRPRLQGPLAQPGHGAQGAERGGASQQGERERGCEGVSAWVPEGCMACGYDPGRPPPFVTAGPPPTPDRRCSRPRGWPSLGAPRSMRTACWPRCGRAWATTWARWRSSTGGLPPRTATASALSCDSSEVSGNPASQPASL